MAAGNSYCLGINSNVFFLKDNKKAFILWLNAPKVTAYEIFSKSMFQVYTKVEELKFRNFRRDNSFVLNMSLDCQEQGRILMLTRKQLNTPRTFNYATNTV